MKRNLPEDVQRIIIDFIGIIDYSKGGCCHTFTKKGKRCKTKPVNNFFFCRKHRNLIKILANGDDIKDIAIAYLLMVYKGPNRKKITSNGIISKGIQEVPFWLGKCKNNNFFFTTKYKKKKQDKGYCLCPWCVEQYFKFFNRYFDRIIQIRQIIHLDGYPYNSIIDLFNNNVLKINETIKRKNKYKPEGFWYRITNKYIITKTIPKKRLLNQFNDYDGVFNPPFISFEKKPIEIIVKSYHNCANNTKSGFKKNGFDDIIKTQYMIGNSFWSRNSHRLEDTCPLVALSSYETSKIGLMRLLLWNLVVFSPKGEGLEPDEEQVIRIELPKDVIRLICSFFYEKYFIFKKSFLCKKRINFWKLVDPKRNTWIKINENGEKIEYDGLAGAGGRL